ISSWKRPAELVRLKVDLIVRFFTPTALAAKQATRDIPIVMAGAGDPVAVGLVASLARPGGNKARTAAHWEKSPDLAIFSAGWGRQTIRCASSSFGSRPSGVSWSTKRGRCWVSPESKSYG